MGPFLRNPHFLILQANFAYSFFHVKHVCSGADSYIIVLPYICSHIVDIEMTMSIVSSIMRLFHSSDLNLPYGDPALCFLLSRIDRN